MNRFFSPNIGTTGRLIRGGLALGLALAAALASAAPWWLRGLLAISAGFVLFEALRGWCVMRACGLKTKF